MSDKQLNYRNSMERLEEILEQMDESDIGVDELAEKVSEAAGLLKSCKKILTDTEKKVAGALDSLDGEFDGE